MARRTYGSSSGSSSASINIQTSVSDNVSDVKKSKPKVPFLFTFIVVLIMISGASLSFFIAYSNHMKNLEIIATWDDVRVKASAEPDIASSVPQTESISTDFSGYETIQDENVPAQASTVDENLLRNFDWDYLLSTNSDILCWLSIPGTTIDYPVMQESVYGETFYLDHDFNKKYLKSGSLFVPKAFDGLEDEDMHLLVFGHNMVNEDVMFHSLLKYKDALFYIEHPYIYLYYPDRVEKWQVWASLHTTRENVVYDLPLEAYTEKYISLIDDLDSIKMYSAGTKPYCDDHILTLSTCDRNATDGADGRFVVNSVLVKTVER